MIRFVNYCKEADLNCPNATRDGECIAKKCYMEANEKVAIREAQAMLAQVRRRRQENNL